MSQDRQIPKLDLVSPPRICDREGNVVGYLERLENGWAYGRLQVPVYIASGVMAPGERTAREGLVMDGAVIALQVHPAAKISEGKVLCVGHEVTPGEVPAWGPASIGFFLDTDQAGENEIKKGTRAGMATELLCGRLLQKWEDDKAQHEGRRKSWPVPGMGEVTKRLLGAKAKLDVTPMADAGFAAALTEVEIHLAELDEVMRAGGYSPAAEILETQRKRKGVWRHDLGPKALLYQSEEGGVTSQVDGGPLMQLDACIARLLSPGGCMEDLASKPEDWFRYLKDEMHELDVAWGTPEAAGELGDVVANALFLLRLHGQEAADLVLQKLVRRHPHVFGDPEGLFDGMLPPKDVAACQAIWQRAKELEKEGRLPDRTDVFISQVEPPVKRSAVVYIAAPYASEDEAGVALNVRRAVALAKLALASGLSPLVIHPAIPAIFTDDTPANRKLGIWSDLEQVKLVAKGFGSLWTLLSDDGNAPAGVSEEMDAWDARAHPYETGREVRTWQDWREAFETQGLLKLWEGATDRHMVSQVTPRPGEGFVCCACGFARAHADGNGRCVRCLEEGQLLSLQRLVGTRWRKGKQETVLRVTRVVPWRLVVPWMGEEPLVGLGPIDGDESELVPLPTFLATWASADSANVTSQVTHGEVLRLDPKDIGIPAAGVAQWDGYEVTNIGGYDRGWVLTRDESIDLEQKRHVLPPPASQVTRLIPDEAQLARAAFDVYQASGQPGGTFHNDFHAERWVRVVQAVKEGLALDQAAVDLADKPARDLILLLLRSLSRVLGIPVPARVDEADELLCRAGEEQGEVTRFRGVLAWVLRRNRRLIQVVDGDEAWAADLLVTPEERARLIEVARETVAHVRADGVPLPGTVWKLKDAALLRVAVRCVTGGCGARWVGFSAEDMSRDPDVLPEFLPKESGGQEMRRFLERWELAIPTKIPTLADMEDTRVALGFQPMKEYAVKVMRAGTVIRGDGREIRRGTGRSSFMYVQALTWARFGCPVYIRGTTSATTYRHATQVRTYGAALNIREGLIWELPLTRAVPEGWWGRVFVDHEVLETLEADHRVRVLSGAKL